MAKFPKGFSLQASPIQAALSEDRTEDAKTLIVEILRTGKADYVVQGLAADLLKPPKRPRGRKRALPRYWSEISEQFNWLRGDGVLYEEALRQLAKKFGCSETHVRTAIRTYQEAKEAHDEASRE
ncbi:MULTISPECIES: hypothetical protein [unclassified Mesorhizobium]|uniref:hypothetical protein n=1 Tax=unclassified Mesorhizobium TaxID=325217 RepID=UPI0003CF9A2A|nr:MULTISPECIES: hypothetical protein [unclassified Mesorhizobium]ESY58308.1 hypothetical protein X745_04230 [Mesorhizobium sp. LNJC374B00]ESY59443.1 hypothetical protein X744_12875 [Mesorhizobium sp. LNJC372A00]WJI79511.1 hypothetical protein NLY34_21940 [Mesorhizobium sp. C374B]WJI86046.1 hypothetical protein NLY42_24335 [Mesorhizobium sp. C372A]